MEKIIPHTKQERLLTLKGYKIIAGVDEVGRGAWAGPVVAAAVVLPKNKRLYKIRDSKVLNTSRREEIFERIYNIAKFIGIGKVTEKEIDRLGLSQAIKLAGNRALENLGISVDYILLDGNWNYLKEKIECQAIIGGDSYCVSVACASVIAKVTRDRLLIKYHSKYPEYDFKNNKGYPSPRHKKALGKFGPCKIHRKSYAPILKLLNRK
jgi:ribonuclease HII